MRWCASVLMLVLASHILVAQTRDKTPRCTSTEFVQQLDDQHPHYARNRATQEAFTDQFLGTRGADSTLITIPVVVHVLYRNPSQNISDAQVQSQINALNRDFGRTNADTALTHDTINALGVDTRIRFCRANLDPDSNATTGITRTLTTVENIGNTNFWHSSANGGHDAWPRDQYLNIWVCELQGALGFAPLPGGPPESDGAVIGFQHFGQLGTATTPYHMGRTCVHEAGHWLNLIHIWGDDSGTCLQDDFVSDTPLQAGNYTGCPTHPQISCGSQDFFMNYMDNTDDSCMNLFTAGQAARMQATLNGVRSALFTSHGCSGTPWPELAAGFTASSIEILQNGTVDFTDQSSGSPISWNWSFEGALPSGTPQTNPQGVSYPDTGHFDVQLIVSDGMFWDTLIVADYIHVKAIQPCDTLLFPLPGTQNLYLAPIGGYVSGTNGYFDRAKANYFDDYAPYSALEGVQLHFAKAVEATSGSTAKIRVMEADGPGGEPGTLRAETSIAYAAIAADVANNEPTWIDWPQNVLLTGPFYIAVELDSTNSDTLALYTNMDFESPAGIAWEQWEDDSWHTYASSWSLRVANAIQPKVCGPIPNASGQINTDLQLAIYPNPASDVLTIEANQKVGQSHIQIVDLYGRIVATTTAGELPSTIDCSKLPPGYYILQLYNGRTRVTKPIMLAR